MVDVVKSQYKKILGLMSFIPSVVSFSLLILLFQCEPLPPKTPSGLQPVPEQPTITHQLIPTSTITDTPTIPETEIIVTPTITTTVTITPSFSATIRVSPTKTPKFSSSVGSEDSSSPPSEPLIPSADPVKLFVKIHDSYCNSGQKVVTKISLEASGGVPPYSYSPEEIFEETYNSGEIKTIQVSVKSSDGQEVPAFVELPQRYCFSDFVVSYDVFYECSKNHQVVTATISILASGAEPPYHFTPAQNFYENLQSDENRVVVASASSTDGQTWSGNINLHKKCTPPEKK